MLEQLSNSPFLYSLALTLLHFLWQGVLITLALKSAFFLISNHKPQLRYALATLAMVLSLLVPVITFAIIYQPEVSFLNSGMTDISVFNFNNDLNQPNGLLNYIDLAEISVFLPYISLLWLASIAFLAFKLLTEIYMVNQLPKHHIIEADIALSQRFRQLAITMNLPRIPKLLISLKADVPMAIGWLKPIVLLPANMISGLNTEQLEMLILHELAHIRRHDYIVNFLQTLVETLLFFHPGVAWISKQMRNEREYCSDDIAVHHCGNAVAYAHTLADTAALYTENKKLKSQCKHTIPTMAMAASGGDLKQRVVRLVDHHCAPANTISKWFAGFSIIISLLLLSSKPLMTISLFDLWANNPVFKFHRNENTPFDENSINSNLIAQPMVLATNTLATQLLSKKTATVSNDMQIVKDEQTDQLKINEMNKAENADIERQHHLKNHFELTIKNQVNNNSALIKEPIIKSTGNSQSDKYSRDENQSSLLEDSRLQGSRLQGNSLQGNRLNEYSTKQDDSSVAQAFERTDSRNKKSYLQNPYANQVIELATTSVLTNIKSTESKPVNVSTENSFKKKPSNMGKENKAVHRIEAKQLVSVEPKYPNIAKRKGIEIEIHVSFTIDVKGNVTDLQYKHHSKLNYFRSAIRDAVKKWHFRPALLNGKPVESQMSKIFSFKLES